MFAPGHRFAQVEFIPMSLSMLNAHGNIVVVDDDPPIWWARDDAGWLKSQSRNRLMLCAGRADS
jgi:hypothetical protein